MKAVADFGKACFNDAATAGAAFAKVNTLLADGTDTDAYFDSIKKASAETGVAVEDFSEAVYQAISASVDQADAVAFTQEAIKLSKGGFTDATTAVDVLTTAINAYGLDASAATKISDMLVTTQNLGKTSVDELASSMGKVIPTANAFGVGIDTLCGAYAVMTKNGIATVWVAAYLSGTTECFELRTVDREDESKYFTLWHKENTIGISLADILYEDLARMDRHLTDIEDRIILINSKTKINESLTVLSSIVNTWLSTSPIFAPFAAQVQRLFIDREGEIMPFTIIRQDITRMKVDAIVNAANTDLAMGGGVCGAIFIAAGPARLQAACDKVAPIKTGGAAITPGFNLPAKFVIHAVGPVYSRQNPGQSEQLLRSAYTESLKLALQHQCGSIAFPLISSGIYGYPKDEALRVATAAIKDFLLDHDMDVSLVIFDRAAFAVSKDLLGAVESYIDEHYVVTHADRRRELLEVEYEAMQDAMMAPVAAPMAASKGLDDLIDELDEPFNTTLLRLIDAKGKTDAEVYKRANIDRKLFSKIRTGKGYMPSKRTILALAIALELTLPETDDLLERAGYALSHSQKFDVIVEYFIVSGKYDIFEINEVLFKYDQPLLGAC